MKYQLFFEMKKILTDKMYIAVFGLIIIIFLIPLMAFPNNNSDKEKTATIENEIYLAEEGIQQMKQQNADMAVKDETERLSLLKNWLKTAKANDSHKELEARFIYEKKFLEQMESGSRVGIPIIEQQKLVAELDYLIDHNLLPLDIFSNSTPGINYISNILQGFLPFTILLILPALIFSNVFSMEKERATKDFLNMTPLKYKVIISSKMIISIGYCIFSFFAATLIAFIITSLKNGIGVLNYPIPRSKDGISVDILTTSQFLIQTFILLLLIFILISCLALLISRFTDNFFVSLFIMLVCVIVPSTPVFSPDSVIASIAHYIPFTYFDFSKVLIFGNEYAPIINEQVSFLNGVINLSFSSMVCVFVSSILIKKKMKV